MLSTRMLAREEWRKLTRKDSCCRRRRTWRAASLLQTAHMQTSCKSWQAVRSRSSVPCRANAPPSRVASSPHYAAPRAFALDARVRASTHAQGTDGQLAVLAHTAGAAAGPRKLVMWTPVDDALLKSSIEGGMSLSDIAAHIVCPKPSTLKTKTLNLLPRAVCDTLGTLRARAWQHVFAARMPT